VHARFDLDEEAAISAGRWHHICELDDIRVDKEARFTEQIGHSETYGDEQNQQRRVR